MKIPFVGVYCPPASRSLKLYHPLSRNRFVPTSENPPCTASHDTASQDKQPWSSRCHLKADHKPKEVQQQLKGNLYKQGKKIPACTNFCRVRGKVTLFRESLHSNTQHKLPKPCTHRAAFARWQEEPQLLPTAQRLHGLTSWQAARSRAEPRCPHISCVSVSSRLYLTLGTPQGTGPLFALCLYCTCQNLIVNYHNWRYRETSRWYRGMLILISSRHQRTAVSFTKEQEVTKELSKSMIDWFLEQK